MSRLAQALGLAEQGFHIFPVAPGAKTPAVDDWPNRATRDAEQITRWWSSRDYNIGIATSRFGDGNALVVIDVDNRENKHGDASLLELELQGLELPVSLEQSTPSGGRHVLYLTDKPLKQGVNVLGPGLDIRSKGGYIVGPGSEIDGKPYQQINGHGALALAPAWLVDRLGRAPVLDRGDPVLLAGVDAGRAHDRALAYLKTAPRSVEGNGGDITAFKVAARLKDLGCSADQAEALMLEHWNDECSPPWGEDELADKVNHAFKYGREPQGSAAPEANLTAVPTPADAADEHPVDKLNRTYAYVKRGAFILHETVDHRGHFVTEHLTQDEMHGWFANKKIAVGEKQVVISRMWVQSPNRREYEGVVFAPERDLGPRWFNMWRGFTYQPAASSDHPAVHAFVEHARNNVCQGSEPLFRWLMGYFAHMIQRPWEKPLTALVFCGKKGTGKNALVERVGNLFRSHFIVVDDDRFLVSHFNSHLESCLFMVLDEAAWAGDKKAEGRLKGLITGADHNIERKGREVYKVDNLTRVAIIGNEDWMVPATNDERRFAVFKVGDGRRQDRKFFRDMRVGMEQGGYAHLLRYLLDYDITGVDVNAAPDTEWLLEQKLESLEPLPKWWHQCLCEGEIAGGDFGGEWPSHITYQRLRDALTRWAKQHNVYSRLPDAKVFGKKLKAMAPSIGYTRTSVDGERQRSYKLPPLSVLRSEWSAHIGQEEDWENV